LSRRRSTSARQQRANAQQCLASERACTDNLYELVVVENSQTDGTPEFLDISKPSKRPSRGLSVSR
jgi:glycosyltransferase involved in cell wall biosynthesis